MATPEENHRRAVWSAFLVHGTHACNRPSAPISAGPSTIAMIGRCCSGSFGSICRKETPSGTIHTDTHVGRGFDPATAADPGNGE